MEGGGGVGAIGLAYTDTERETKRRNLIIPLFSLLLFFMLSGVFSSTFLLSLFSSIFPFSLRDRAFPSLVFTAQQVVIVQAEIRGSLSSPGSPLISSVASLIVHHKIFSVFLFISYSSSPRFHSVMVVHLIKNLGICQSCNQVLIPSRFTSAYARTVM